MFHQTAYWNSNFNYYSLLQYHQMATLFSWLYMAFDLWLTHCIQYHQIWYLWFYGFILNVPAYWVGLWYYSFFPNSALMGIWFFWCFWRKDYFQEGDTVYSSLPVMVAFRKAVTTWASWVDKNIDPKRTKVFFCGYSPSHFRWVVGTHEMFFFPNYAAWYLYIFSIVC